MASETLTLQTVSTNEVIPSTRKTKEPYKRVVGIYGMGEELWSRTDIKYREPLTPYAQADASPEEIEFPDYMGERLLAFFERYFVKDAMIVQKARMSLLTGQHYEVDEYNCHRFAYWMKGVPAAQSFDVPEAPDHIVTDGMEVPGSLDMGRHGAFGSRNYRRAGAALHSVIGLGVDRNDCLQVTGIGGLMGVDTYSNLRELYHSELFPTQLYAFPF